MCTEGGYNEKAPSSGWKVQCGGVLSELVGVKHADRASHAGDVLDRTQPPDFLLHTKIVEGKSSQKSYIFTFILYRYGNSFAQGSEKINTSGGIRSHSLP